MNLFNLVTGISLLLFNMVLSEHLVLFNALCGLFFVSIRVSKILVPHMRQHGRHDIARMGEYTYFAFLVSLTWALSRGTGQNIHLRPLLPQMPPESQLPSNFLRTKNGKLMSLTVAQLLEIWSTWGSGAISTCSASIRRLFEPLATFWASLTFWKTRSTDGPRLDRVQLVYSNITIDKGTICLLCRESIDRQNSTLYLCCAKQHCFHLACATKPIVDFSLGTRRCPICREQLLAIEQPEATKNETGTKKKKRNKKQKQKQKKKHEYRAQVCD